MASFPPSQFHPQAISNHATPTPPPLLEDDSDKSSTSSFSIRGGVAQSAAENAREKKLRDDPMAIVIGPLYVDCRRCGSRIKLSTKSLYDACHWRTHRSRCLKRHSTAPQKRSAKAEIIAPPKRSSQLEVSQTPPPLLDTGERQVCASLSPSFPSTPPPPQPHADAMEEYLLRSHGKKQIPPLSTLTHWQDWSWSQLRLPRFISESPNYNDDDGNDYDSYMDGTDAVSAAVF
ncbi:hypothetical protein DXG03_007786 [Asterophora parasitica]|uniref:Uncharacterized protein n=1 Tax=Asterophora parasitica TaxID=117018 RepID=A0A9P7GJ05_9AGAR|nr:hypothetical protein DXG03_007786 [Asterophora parasitica]